LSREERERIREEKRRGKEVRKMELARVEGRRRREERLVRRVESVEVESSEGGKEEGETEGVVEGAKEVLEEIKEKVEEKVEEKKSRWGWSR